MLGRCALSCLRKCHSQLARSAQPAIKPGRYRFRGREGEGGGSTWEHCHPMSPWRERAYLSMRRGFPCDFKHWRLNVPLSKACDTGTLRTEDPMLRSSEGLIVTKHMSNASPRRYVHEE